MPRGHCPFLPCFGASKPCLFCPCRPITAEEQRKSAAEAALFCYFGAYAKRMLEKLHKGENACLCTFYEISQKIKEPKKSVALSVVKFYYKLGKLNSLCVKTTFETPCLI